MNNGLKFGSTDKWNNKACREIVDILAKVIRDVMKGYFAGGNFLAFSGDATLVLIAGFRAGLAGLNLGCPENPGLKPRKPS